MKVVTASRTRPADKYEIYKMREAGAPMRAIAEVQGISKERVRQILSRRYGTTDHGWLSTLQICAATGLPRNKVLELFENGIITPAVNWKAGKRHYLLWNNNTVSEVNQYYQEHHLCQVCQCPLPKNRIIFCSDACRQERHKYKYMTLDEKKRVLNNIRRYRERKRSRTTGTQDSRQSETIILAAMR